MYGELECVMGPFGSGQIFLKYVPSSLLFFVGSLWIFVNFVVDIILQKGLSRREGADRYKATEGSHVGLQKKLNTSQVAL